MIWAVAMTTVLARNAMPNAYATLSFRCVRGDHKVCPGKCSWLVIDGERAPCECECHERE